MHCLYTWNAVCTTLAITSTTVVLPYWELSAVMLHNKQIYVHMVIKCFLLIVTELFVEHQHGC